MQMFFIYHDEIEFMSSHLVTQANLNDLFCDAKTAKEKKAEIIGFRL